MNVDTKYFAGKTVVVTGAASGIGLAIIEELLSYRASKAVLADFNQENLTKHTERLAAEYPGKVTGILCDITKEEQVKNMIAKAHDFCDGRIDILFNNAGAGLGGFFVEPTDRGDMSDEFKVQTNDDWKKAFDLNFYGALYGCREAIPLMQKQGGGQIINVISGIVNMPMPYQTMYAATKAALSALSLSLRYEFWDDNIKIAPATPGTTATAIWGDLDVPETAQTPQQSAQRILAGVAKNDRIIYGDDGDVSGGQNGASSNPEIMKFNDEYLLNIARIRRTGKVAV